MNVNELLDGSGFLSRKEKESFLNSSYLGTPWRIYHNLFEEYSEQKGLVSDFNNEVLKLLIENAGDWHDCLPYGPDSLDKLTNEEKDDLNAILEYVTKVLVQYNFRTTSLWGD